MSLTRRSLLASFGIALPVALTAVGAEAATVPTLHRHKRHHTHAANAHTRHRKPHHTTAAVDRPRTQG